ncbi:MAG: hypothetical protein QXG02_03060 [Candidatus Anstonellales archaeon]
MNKFFGVLVVSLFLLVGCINLPTSTGGGLPSNKVCTTIIKDKSTGEMVYKSVSYELRKPSESKYRLVVEYIDKERYKKDQVFSSEVLYLGEDWISIDKENSTHYINTFYSKPSIAAAGGWYLEEFYGKELVDKYFSDCVWSEGSLVNEKKEETLSTEKDEEWKKKYEETKAQHEKEFSEKYEKTETCSPGAFGEEMFIPSGRVCSLEEIKERMDMMNKEYENKIAEQYSNLE